MFGKRTVNEKASFQKPEGHTSLLSEEAQLWLDFKQGDQKAFAKVYQQHYRRLYNYGYTLFADKEILKDTLQELFFTLWRDREKLGQVHSVRFYLLTAFRRKLIHKINQDRKRKTWVQDKPVHEESYEFELIHAQNETAQKDRLHQELENLPRRQREALYLRFYQELTYTQITELMQLQYQTVRDLVHKALKTLREKLKSASQWQLLWLFTLALSAFFPQ